MAPGRPSSSPATLAKVNEEWKNNVGTGSTVKWPIGLGGKGNDGIAAFVQRLPVQLVTLNMLTLSRTTLAYTKLISADGKPVLPTEENFANAAKGADWSKTFAQGSDQPERRRCVAYYLYHVHSDPQRSGRNQNKAQKC